MQRLLKMSRIIQDDYFYMHNPYFAINLKKRLLIEQKKEGMVSWRNVPHSGACHHCGVNIGVYSA